jgi:hypothetical protein
MPHLWVSGTKPQQGSALRQGKGSLDKVSTAHFAGEKSFLSSFGEWLMSLSAH